jgi:hypothetical protein
MELAIDIECSAQVVPGSDMPCELYYENRSNVTIHNATINKVLPEHVTVKKSANTVAAGWQENAIDDGTLLTKILGDMSSGKSGTISFELSVSDEIPDRNQVLTRAIIQGEYEDGDTVTAEASTITLVAWFRSYLPVVASLPKPPIIPEAKLPDLAGRIVGIEPDRTNFAAGEPVTVTVEVTNQGEGPTTTGFWVDLYLNPSVAPSLNQRWDDICGLFPCHGVAWSINHTLAPSETITLTTSYDYAENQTIWPGWFASGTNSMYLQVDSWNCTLANGACTTHGAVPEENEVNNLFGMDGLVVTGENPSFTISVPRSGSNLPTRELPEISP